MILHSVSLRLPFELADRLSEPNSRPSSNLLSGFDGSIHSPAPQAAAAAAACVRGAQPAARGERRGTWRGRKLRWRRPPARGRRREGRRGDRRRRVEVVEVRV